MSELVKILDETTFAKEIETGVTLVDFWAPWCGPCRMQIPILEELAPQVAGKATVAKVNVDECPGIAAQFGIRSIPTLILYKDGTAMEQMVGVQKAADLKTAIERL